MIGFLRTGVRKKPFIALYFESENELQFYNLEARFYITRHPTLPTGLATLVKLDKLNINLNISIGKLESRKNGHVCASCLL